MANPYDPSPGFPEQGPDPRQARELVNVPAILLMVTGGLGVRS